MTWTRAIGACIDGTYYAHASRDRADIARRMQGEQFLPHLSEDQKVFDFLLTDRRQAALHKLWQHPLLEAALHTRASGYVDLLD